MSVRLLNGGPRGTSRSGVAGRGGAGPLRNTAARPLSASRLSPPPLPSPPAPPGPCGCHAFVTCLTVHSLKVWGVRRTVLAVPVVRGKGRKSASVMDGGGAGLGPGRACGACGASQAEQAAEAEPRAPSRRSRSSRNSVVLASGPRRLRVAQRAARTRLGLGRRWCRLLFSVFIFLMFRDSRLRFLPRLQRGWRTAAGGVRPRRGGRGGDGLATAVAAQAQAQGVGTVSPSGG